MPAGCIMFFVRHVNPASSLPLRLRRVAMGLTLAACAASLPSLAGQASATFSISIQLVPEGVGTCAASTSTGAPQVTCRPTVVAAAGAAGGTGERQGDSTVVGYRVPETHLKLAKLVGGEMVEVGAENFYAWTDNSSYALGEYSSRLIMAGGVSYVEMTVSW